MDLISAEIPLDRINEARTGQTRDLADWIRTFGTRLDSNFHRWHRLAA